ncbi:uncharacterized protein LOC134813483 isoform X3 [Bolinopsis microptera]|uniref:uncharacterized protein LOC134813483 isoform X3 n=1 Tax=Bolinopsis microptera TaxID=2820187 RepID=UPI003078FBB7
MNYVELGSMNDELRSEYGLANSLHELPHLNLSLQDIVHKNFNFSNDQYIQSLEVYSLSGVVFGVALFITFGFIQCCLGCRRCGGYSISYRMKQYDPILTTFLFCCSLAVMATTTVSLYYGVGKVQGDVSRMSVFIKDISLTIDQYDKVMSDMQKHIISLKNNTKDLPRSSYISTKLLDIEKEIERDKIPDFDDDIKRLIKYNRARELVTLALLMLQMFCCATLLIGICYGRVFVLHCSLVMLTLCMFFLSASIGIYLSGAVASADICVEHTEFMRYIIDVEELAEDVVKLFLRCKEDGSTGLKSLDLVSGLLSFLDHIPGPVQLVPPQVKDTLIDLTSDMNNIQHIMACQQLTKDYKGITDILCKPFLWNMSMYCLVTCISVFLVWIVINQLKPYADRVEEWLKVECILDKNITMTPDADENDHLITDTSYPPPYRPNYGSLSYSPATGYSKSFSKSEDLDPLLQSMESIANRRYVQEWFQYGLLSRGKRAG